jgi:maleylpyruvate isomerase
MAAHQRLLADVSDLSDSQVRAASRLSGWSVGHVLTHLARNADAHARRIEGALRGEDVPKYPGGAAQRENEIEAGASRPVKVIVEDLVATSARLDALFVESVEAGWPNGHARGSGGYGPRACPAHRLREVEMHHVDLGLGYEPQHWPEEYVAWDLHLLLATVPARLARDDQRRSLMAWLAGRGELPVDIRLAPWG